MPYVAINTPVSMTNPIAQPIHHSRTLSDMVDVASHLAEQPSRKLCTTRRGLRVRRACMQHDSPVASTHNNDSTSSRKITQEVDTSATSLPALAGRPLHRLIRSDESQRTRHPARATDWLDRLEDKDKHSRRYASAQVRTSSSHLLQKKRSGAHQGIQLCNFFSASGGKHQEKYNMNKTAYASGTGGVSL